MSAPIAPGRAVYAIYTSPTHPPMPDHLPTLIVTPSGKPQSVLYTYLHTNYNQENYLLTPSPDGDLCIAKLFPSPSILSPSEKGSKTVRCEASRSLRWFISNTGIAMPTYKLTLPNSDPASGSEDQPLFQVSKTSRSSSWWTLWYFTYAGHLIPPKRVEFGKIEKDNGATRVIITGKSDEEKAVWKTLGDGNEDMVEWIVLCASLHVLDEEIRDAAKASGQALKPPPSSSRADPNRANSRGSSKSDLGVSVSQQQQADNMRPQRSHSSLDGAERASLERQAQRPQNGITAPNGLDGRLQDVNLARSPPPAQRLAFPQQQQQQPQSQPRQQFPPPVQGRSIGSQPHPQQMQQSPPRQRTLSGPADPRQRQQENRPFVPLPQQNGPPPMMLQPGRTTPVQGPPQQRPPQLPSQSIPVQRQGPNRMPSPIPPPSSQQLMSPPNGYQQQMPLRPGAMQAQSGPLKRPGPSPGNSIPNGPRMPSPLPSAQNAMAMPPNAILQPTSDSRQPISPNVEYFQGRNGMRRPSNHSPPPQSSSSMFSPPSGYGDNGMVMSPQSLSPEKPTNRQMPPTNRPDQMTRPVFVDDEPTELAYARTPSPQPPAHRGPRSMPDAPGRGVQLTDVNLSR